MFTSSFGSGSETSSSGSGKMFLILTDPQHCFKVLLHVIFVLEHFPHNQNDAVNSNLLKSQLTIGKKLFSSCLIYMYSILLIKYLSVPVSFCFQSFHIMDRPDSRKRFRRD
jgi:hypothetical protein